MIFLVAFFMSLVYLYVRSLDVKMNQYTETYARNAENERSGAMDASGGRRPSFIKSFSTTRMEEIQEQRKYRKNERSKAVANQGLFYAGTFALVWIFGTIVRAMQLAGAKPPWAIVFLFGKYLYDVLLTKSVLWDEKAQMCILFYYFFYAQPSSRPVKDSSTFWSMFDLELSNITPRRRREEIL